MAVRECDGRNTFLNDLSVKTGWKRGLSEGSSGTLKLIDIPTSPTIVEYESIIIIESTPSVIEVGQVYEDKQTIASVMKHYSVMNKFQFRVKRSSARRYWLVPYYHLAYAVVDSENDASWKWFFEQFKHAYGKRPNMYVVSDQNECILKETSIVYPDMPHYSCMWHIWTNIRAKFKKGHLKLSELYFATARSYTLDEFNERMSKIEEIDPRVKAYLYDIGYHRWSRVHAMVNKTLTMTSNIIESLNAVTKDARERPIVELLEYMRTLLERWTNEKLLKAKGTFAYLGFKFNKELDDNRTFSHKLRVRASTDYIHTVLDGAMLYIVCLENKRCSCGQFQLDELPCPHALAALRHKDESYEQYCSPYYTRESLLHTYEIPVNPLPDESKWNVPQHIT
ncbi:uncharacterized protein LOC107792194 [Nicotiana tabacum]|uniref:Uncharacterized protein LOC107792194 n=1 Tax=Nicotiana tabacum TaxID=4097 RepID=A0AC58RV65_TOBAC